MAARLNMAQTFHQGIEFLGSASLRRVLQQPFAEFGVERFVPGTRYQPRLLNEILVRAQSDILQTILVYTNLVRIFSYGSGIRQLTRELRSVAASGAACARHSTLRAYDLG